MPGEAECATIQVLVRRILLIRPDNFRCYISFAKKADRLIQNDHPEDNQQAAHPEKTQSSHQERIIWQTRRKNQMQLPRPLFTSS